MARERRRFGTPTTAASARTNLAVTRELERAGNLNFKRSGSIIGTVGRVAGRVGRTLIGAGRPQIQPTGPTFTGATPALPPSSGGGVAQQACNLIPNPTLRAACEAGRRAFGGGGGGGGGSSSTPVTNFGDPLCPEGTFRVGDRCIAPGDMFPGGDPGMFEAGGIATEGAFGLPALTPVRQERVRLECPAGMVLGKDNLCYPRQILTRSSRFRKWRPAPRPQVSAADAKAVRKAARVKEKLAGLAKESGLRVTRK